MTIKDLIIQYKAELALTNKQVENLKIQKDVAECKDHWDMHHGQQMFAEGRAQKLSHAIKDMESIDE